jgi:hypothetical protein
MIKPFGSLRSARPRAGFYAISGGALVVGLGLLAVAWTRSMSMRPTVICGGLFNRPEIVVHVGDHLRCEIAVSYRPSYVEFREASGLSRFVRLTSSDPRVLRTDADTAVIFVGPGRAAVVATLGWMKSGRTFTVEPAVARVQLTPSASVVHVGDTVHFQIRALAADGRVLTGVPVHLSYLISPSLRVASVAPRVMPTQPGPMTVVGIAGPARDSVVLDVRAKGAQRQISR